MKIEKLTIDNFKSLNNFTLENPNPFSVFVGANGVGKSNIFEALEYLNYRNPFESNSSKQSLRPNIIDNLFGGFKNFLNFNRIGYDLVFSIQFEDNKILKFTRYGQEKNVKIIGQGSEKHVAVSNVSGLLNSLEDSSTESESEIYKQLVSNFSRIFIKHTDKKKIYITSDDKLNFDCSNLEKVLKRLLLDADISEEIKDWLSLFVPAFKNIEIKSDELSGTDTLLFYEKDSEHPFTKNLISDGTFNILCLLVAVYQSDSPQFICIEEPEIGLNPYVVKELVSFFREQCQEKGHYIWINTHSETLVRELLPEEIIVINKEDGNTQAKQFIGKNMHGLSMDTAWLTNFLGGGIPW